MVDPRYYAENAELCLAANRRYFKTEKGRAARARATRAYRERHKAKLAAHCAVTYAVRIGTLQRWPCEVCGEKAEAHHPDYSRPLMVTWLCEPHHKQAHNETA